MDELHPVWRVTHTHGPKEFGVPTRSYPVGYHVVIDDRGALQFWTTRDGVLAYGYAPGTWTTFEPWAHEYYRVEAERAVWRANRVARGEQ